MQTFLPYPDYAQSAKVLDRQRLGKQRVEVLQLLNVLHEITPGYSNHPAAKMWRGYEFMLAVYGQAICLEWVNRGYQDTCFAKIEQHRQWAIDGGNFDPPFWMGDEDFHRAHQSNLVRKDPAHYRQYFPDVPDNLEYIWPV